MIRFYLVKRGDFMHLSDSGGDKKFEDFYLSLALKLSIGGNI